MKPKFWLVLMGLMIGFYSCDKSGVILPPIHITGLTLDKTTLSLVMGTEGQLKATIAPAEAEVVAVKWASSAPLVATVTESGNVVALTAGTTNITAVVGSFVATCVVTVTAQKVSVTGVVLGKKTLSLGIGGAETLVATVAPATATDPSVGWLSSDPLVATVSETGVVTALAIGTATITVTTTDGAKSAICAVTVSQLPTVITLNKTTLVLPFSTKDTLIATVVPTQTEPVIIWSSSDPLVATVSQSGEVSALKVGQTIVTATCDGQSATCAVTVSQLPTVITLNKTTLVLPFSTKETLVATVVSTQTDPVVTWSSSDPLVATVSQSGEVSALKVGQVIVTATCDGQSAACAVTVDPWVYVVGAKSPSADPFTQALLWVNGQEHLLSDPTKVAIAQSIFISGSGDIYVAGDENNAGKIWKNEQPLYTFADASARSVSVAADGVVYTAVSQGVHEAQIWRNGSRWHILSTNGEAHSIFTSGNDVYAVGVKYPSTPEAVLWKEVGGQSSEVMLPWGGHWSRAHSVVVSDGDVYVGGLWRDTSVIPEIVQAIVWKNELLLYDLSTPGSEAGVNSLAVSGDDLYAVGYGDRNSTTGASMVKVWKNDQLLYNLSDGTTFAEATGVVVAQNGDVYVVGYEGYNVVERVSKVWRNGALLYALSNGATGVWASAIALREQ